MDRGPDGQMNKQTEEPIDRWMDVHIHMNFSSGYPEGCDLNLQIAGEKKAKFFPLSTQNLSQNEDNPDTTQTQPAKKTVREREGKKYKEKRQEMGNGLKACVGLPS